MEPIKKPIGLETLGTIDPNLETLLKNLIQKELAVDAIKFYSGKVINNKDPEQLGRCQIKVFGIFEDSIPDDALPWALPDDKFVGSMVGSMIVPPKDALVRVYFDHNDIYSPIYTTKIPEKKFKSRHISKDYPDTLLFFETDAGDYMTINKKRSEITFHAAGGTLVRIDRKGNLSVDTTEADPLYGGGFSLDVNGDVTMKTVGDVTIDAVGPPLIPVVPDPTETDPDALTNPRANLPSRANINTTGQINNITIGTEDTPGLRREPPPDPKDPIAVALKKLEKFKTPTGATKESTINFITSLGDINFNSITGEVYINGTKGVKISSKVEVSVEAPSVKLGNNATNDVLNSRAVAKLYDSHKHGTAQGPSTPPLPPDLMTPQLTTLTSKIVKTSL